MIDLVQEKAEDELRTLSKERSKRPLGIVQGKRVYAEERRSNGLLLKVVVVFERGLESIEAATA